MQELDERKTKILKAIIQNYMQTGDPVGSRTISKLEDINLSSATIRNEMSDLEELGYIIQPHTSAGRIPSDKGYRFYVDNMMEEHDRKMTEMQDFVIEHTEKMEHVLKDVVKLLALNTNYATMISAPRVSGSRLKFIQLSAVAQGQVLATIVLDGNLVKNKMIHTDTELTQDMILKLNILLNTSLNGLSLSEINLGTITALKDQAEGHKEVVSDVIDAVADAIRPDEDLEVYTSGAKNIFRYPELSDSQRASDLISAFEDKTQLKDLLLGSSDDDDDKDFKVYIGGENSVQEMKDCSVVTATYELAEGVSGKIGIVGPKRMDYEKVVDSLKMIKAQLDDIYKSKNEFKSKMNIEITDNES